MKALFSRLQAHTHVVVSVFVGIVAALVVPGVEHRVARALVGWDVGVWFYLAWAAWTMFRSGADRVEQVAKAQAESAGTVLAVVAAGAVSSFVAVIVELAAAKSGGGHPMLANVALTLTTVFGSWTLVPTLFSLNYASRYHVSRDDDGGLQFPNQKADFAPDYTDFLYFSFTIAVASQTSDVVITNREMRRLALLQSVLSFIFNTTVLAFSINIAASLI